MVCSNCGYKIDAEGIVFCPRCGAKVNQPEETVTKEVIDDPISKIWSEWHTEKVLGKGSFGTVYQVVRKNKNLESHAAVKVISIPTDKAEINSLQSEGMSENEIRTYYEEIVEDFENEIRVMESLKGMQNVVSVEDYKIVERKREIGWDIYIRMELLTPFSDYITDKKLTEKEVIKIGVDICSALELCNKMNIIHRDIKPENIFVNSFGYFKLGDFGIARKLENMTGGLSQKGTYSYMAPEVVYGNKYDEKVDTYSLGLVLYRLLNNNRMPFVDTQKPVVSASERKEANDRRIMGEPLESPCNASKEMAEIILKACEYNPDDRYASATEFKKALLQRFVSKPRKSVIVPPSKPMVDEGVETVVAQPVVIPQRMETPIVPPVQPQENNYVTPPSPMAKYEETIEEETDNKRTIIVIIAIIVALAIFISSLFIFREPITDFIEGLGDRTSNEEKLIKAEEETSEEDKNSSIEDTMNVTDSGDCGDNLTWKYDNSTGLLFISGAGAMYDFTSAPWNVYNYDIKK